MKVLYLDTNTDQSNDYIREQRMKEDNVDSYCIYNTKKRTLFFKIIQFLGIYIYSPILNCIYGDWKKKIDEYDLFIVTSRKSCKYALKLLKKKTNKRIVVWYWNLFSNKEINPKYCRKLGCETWTFDIDDAKKYDMKFNDTYYFYNECEKEKHEDNIEYDFFYCGLNKKGREKELIKFVEYCEEKGLTYKIHLVGSNYPKFNNNRLNYEEIIKNIKKSKAIIDLNIEKQSGMTLRVLESVYYKKMLVTNNKSIVNYKAYIANNVYIIENSKYLNLKEFIDKKFVRDKSVENFYMFSSWLERIKNNINLLTSRSEK